MREQWIKWQPVDGLLKKYYIKSIVHNDEEFKITFCSCEESINAIQMTFDRMDSYRIQNETFRKNTIDFLYKNHGEDFYNNWTFFKVENSLYIQLTSEESCGWSSASRKFIHFSFITSFEIVDVLATREPYVELVNFEN